MNIQMLVRRASVGAKMTVLTGLMVSTGLVAQDTTTSNTYQSGSATVSTDVVSAKVIYVSGNTLIVKGQDGQVKHFVVPDSTVFHVDGKDLNVKQLKVGMTLTRTITTTEVPKTVKTVRTISGKVWLVNAPSTVILTLPDGTNKQYNVPSGQTFMIDGKPQTVFELRKGMNVSATVVTDSPVVVASSKTHISGVAPPPPPPPKTPPMVGVILIEEPAPAPAPAPAPVQEAKATLPKTASNLPLIGLMGVLLLGAGFSLRSLRS